MLNLTGNNTIDIRNLFSSLNALIQATNQKQQFGTFGTEGKEGDIRSAMSKKNEPYLQFKGRQGWFSSFKGCFSLSNEPEDLHLVNLEVDNLFAKNFTVNQTNAINGNYIMSDFGVVESFTASTITFVDQTNLGLCSFAVNDKCEVRRIKADKSLDIKLVQFTVTAVTGKTVTVTYTSANTVAKGDIVVRKGNSSNTSRQASIYFSTTDTTNPYIDFYSGITGFTYGSPKVALGDLTHVVDSTFNPVSPYHLSGVGLYADNVYLKGKLQITSNADIIGLTRMNATYSSGVAFPTSPAPEEGDWHFYTKDPPDSPYLTNTWYRYSGSAWVVYGLTGTYIDGTGIYTGTVVADHILAGTLDVALTMSTGGTLTVGNPTGQRIILDGTNNLIDFYSSAGSAGSLYGGNVTGIGNMIKSSGSFGIEYGNLYLGASSSIIVVSTPSGLSITPTIGGSDVSWAVSGDIYMNTYLVATQSWVSTNYTTFPGFGTSGSTACVGNDSRLSDARTPASHDNTYHSTAYATGAWGTVSSTPTTADGTVDLTINGTTYTLLAVGV